MILTVLLINVLHGGAEELHTKVTRGLFITLFQSSMLYFWPVRLELFFVAPL